MCSCADHYQPQRESIYLPGERLIKGCCKCVLNAQKLECPAPGECGKCLDPAGLARKHQIFPSCMCEFCDGATRCRGSKSEECLGGVFVQLLGSGGRVAKHWSTSGHPLRKRCLWEDQFLHPLLPTKSCMQGPRDSCILFAKGIEHPWMRCQCKWVRVSSDHNMTETVSRYRRQIYCWLCNSPTKEKW